MEGNRMTAAPAREKASPKLMFAPAVLAIFNILTFTVFPVQGIAKILLCGVCYIGAGIAYTAWSAIPSSTATGIRMEIRNDK